MNTDEHRSEIDKARTGGLTSPEFICVNLYLSLDKFSSPKKPLEVTFCPALFVK